jgi:RNA polymerase sigma-70 factor (ECF subfamily)
MHKDKSDEEIVELLKAGNKDIFAEIIDRYESKMVRYGSRYFKDKEDVTDLVQDVFVKVYTNIKSFSSGERFSPWIYRIAHNTFVNKIAWKSIRNYISIDADEFLPHSLPAPENVMRESIKREERELMSSHIAELPEKYKTPLILFFYEDQSYEEISEVLKIPISTVGVRIKRGKDKLKELLHHYE